MRIGFQRLLGGIVFCVSSAAYASGIAVINIEGAMLNSDYAASAIKAFESSPLIKDAQVKEAALNKMQEERNVNWDLTWGDEQKKAFNERFQKTYGEYQALGQQLQQERAKIEQGIAATLNPKVTNILQSLVKEKKIDLLLKSGAVYYRTPDYDLTEVLLKRLNKAVPAEKAAPVNKGTQ